MPDPSTLADMDRLAARLAAAIANNERVALFGDYDVDGASSCALMARYLKHFGLSPEVYIPDRIFEGYGPNIAAIDKLIDNGATLLITLDCGTVSDGPIAHARERGLDVLVIDHHLSDHELPPATALVNPNRPDDISGLGYLCAAGVTFMVLVATNRVLRQRGDTGLPDLMSMIDLVALATVCDVVPLNGLNRAFVVRGLEVARRQQSRHRRAGAGGAGDRATQPLPSRLSRRPADQCRRPHRRCGAGHAAAVARRRARGAGDRRAAQRAQRRAPAHRDRGGGGGDAAAEAEIGGGEGPPVLVLASANWHAGIIGIIAGRLRERFERPAFAIALRPTAPAPGRAARCPASISARRDRGGRRRPDRRGGGHAMAAGVTLKPGPDRAVPRASDRSGWAAASGVARGGPHLAKIDAAMTARGAPTSSSTRSSGPGRSAPAIPQPVFAFPGPHAQIRRGGRRGRPCPVHLTSTMAPGSRPSPSAPRRHRWARPCWAPAMTAGCISPAISASTTTRAEPRCNCASPTLPRCRPEAVFGKVMLAYRLVEAKLSAKSDGRRNRFAARHLVMAAPHLVGPTALNSGLLALWISLAIEPNIAGSHAVDPQPLRTRLAAFWLGRAADRPPEGGRGDHHVPERQGRTFGKPGTGPASPPRRAQFLGAPRRRCARHGRLCAGLYRRRRGGRRPDGAVPLFPAEPRGARQRRELLVRPRRAGHRLSLEPTQLQGRFEGEHLRALRPRQRFLRRVARPLDDLFLGALLVRRPDRWTRRSTPSTAASPRWPGSSRATACSRSAAAGAASPRRWPRNMAPASTASR